MATLLPQLESELVGAHLHVLVPDVADETLVRDAELGDDRMRVEPLSTSTSVPAGYT